MTGFPERTGCRKPLILVPALQLCLLLSGCGLFDHDYNSPEPNTLDFHKHTAILRLRTINHAADTLGVVAATTYGSFQALREVSSRLSRNFAVPAYIAVPTQFVFSDTSTHACTLKIDHFVGYQTRYGGDTSRFSAMDGYGEWSLELFLNGTRVAFANGETMDVSLSHGPDLPDTVRPSDPYVLDISADLAGLFKWREALDDYELQTDHIQVRQR